MKMLSFALFLFAAGCIIGHVCGCASLPSEKKEFEAETAYGAQQYQECIAPERLLSPLATREEKVAAWDRVDKCRAKVRERWGIVQTVTLDGGDQ